MYSKCDIKKQSIPTPTDGNSAREYLRDAMLPSAFQSRGDNVSINHIEVHEDAWRKIFEVCQISEHIILKWQKPKDKPIKSK
jgi:hypothetical protein